MVIGAFPAAKLGALLLRQISKPIANAVKQNAKNSPVFRKYVCLPPAHFYNWCEVKLKMWILNLGKPVNIPVLNESMAIELGANLLGEGIIFLVAAGVLIIEYSRSARKEAAKEEAKRKEMEEVQDKLKMLFIQSEEQAAHLRELMRKIGDLDTRLGEITMQSNHPPPKLPPPAAKSPDLPVKEKDITKTNFPVSGLSLYNTNNSSLAQSNLVLRAVNDVEQQFWNYPLIERQPSLLVLGLFYVNKVFRYQQ